MALPHNEFDKKVENDYPHKKRKRHKKRHKERELTEEELTAKVAAKIGALDARYSVFGRVTEASMEVLPQINASTVINSVDIESHE